MKIYIPSFSFKCGYICLFWHGNPFLRWSKKELEWNESRPPGNVTHPYRPTPTITYVDVIRTQNAKYLLSNMFIRDWEKFYFLINSYERLGYDEGTCVARFSCWEMGVMHGFILKITSYFCAKNCHCWTRRRSEKKRGESAKNMVTEVLHFTLRVFCTPSLSSLP